MNCIWILLLLSCFGGNNCSRNDGCGNLSDRSGECGCGCGDVEAAREPRERIHQEVREEVREEVCDRGCASGRRERGIPSLRSDYSNYDSYDNNMNYERRSDRHDDNRGTGRCDTCGCEA